VEIHLSQLQIIVALETMIYLKENSKISEHYLA